MGNKLCAPWKRGFREEDHPWTPKKDSHLLRLWAEIFEVREEDREICWARVSDDVVPVNITCIEDSPETVFQITAYNRHVEKIFDVRLIQPGTRITQASECFVHWKDSGSDHEWGLNFTAPVDARRFRDCCMASSGHSYARKASSSGSLRLSPPKRVRGRKTASNPTSPLSNPRRAVSSPDDLALHDGIAAGFVATPGEEHSLSSMDSPSQRNDLGTVEPYATVPRHRQRNINNVQSVFDKDQGDYSPVAMDPRNSVYDNVDNARRCDPRFNNGSATRVVSQTPQPQQVYQYDCTMHRPIGEREIPYSHYQSTGFNTYHYHPRSVSEDRTHARNISFGNYSTPAQSERVTVDKQEDYAPPLPEPRQIRQVSPARNIPTEPEKLPTNRVYDNLPEPKDDNVFAPGCDRRGSGRKRPPLVRTSHSSSDWPPPPDPPPPETVTPDTPVISTTFDSSTLKKLLRSFPDAAPVGSPPESGFVPVETSHYVPPASTGSSPIRAASSPRNTVSDTEQTSGIGIRLDPISTLPHPGSRLQAPEKPERFIIDYQEPPYRDRRCRDSYPDSGISGMTLDTTGSVRSGDSGKSARSSKSATLPPGVGLNWGGARSAAYSGGTSGRRSDLIREFGPHSEDSEVRHMTSSDISDTDSESSSEEGTSDSSIRTMPSESQASFASKSSAIRKAGWLTVKNWLIHKKRKIELAPKRTWKKYWVCLKGTVLLFYACDENEPVRENIAPRHMLVIEGGIAQAVPEHPKRDFILALSTAFGDAYLFQAPSPGELESWISGLHSACASSYARQHGKENTVKLLRSEIHKLENSIDLDIKMKKMAGLQMSVVADPKSKAAIEKQIAQWDENVEKLYVEQYRLRCYMASLQGTELPNPKTLLGCMSKNTKASLNRVGVFTVTSFHACVCARSPLTSTSMYSRNKKRGLLSTFKADSVTKIRPRSPQSCQVYRNTDINDHIVVDLGYQEEDQVSLDTFNFCDSLVRIALPNNQTIVIGITEKTTVQDALEAACNRRQLNPIDHFIRLKMLDVDTYRIPDKTSLLQSEEYESIEICQKILFQMDVSRGEKDKDFGFNVEAELAEDAEQEDELCVFISEVTKGGLAHRRGLVVGDEILVLDGKVVAELDMVYVENLLQDSTAICMTVRSCRIERPVSTSALTDQGEMYIENMVCPPPPSQSRISDKTIGELIVPAPAYGHQDPSSAAASPLRPAKDVADMSSEQIDNLLQGVDQVTHFCRVLHSPAPDAMNSDDLTSVKPLSDAQRLRKVIVELIETERHYVKDLNCLIERYLEPLKEETFLSGEDIEHLFGNLQEIVQFQRLFLQSLEEAVEQEFSSLGDPCHFRRVLFSVGGSFLYYANQFKLYSSFCASHSRVQKVLNPGNNIPLQEFLRARNPKQQHSATLESYLIKPIQRILKYPLLLRQLKDLTDAHSDEHQHLSEALRGMEAVAEHINEMQKIYEEYGSVFDELIRQYKESNPHRKGLDLNVGDLQMYGNVTWLNALDELGKMKKGTDLITLVFIFKPGMVLLALERQKGKRRIKPGQGKPLGGPDSSDIIRYTSAIAVDQLQVRSTASDTERHGLWELVHCRSEKEGRPEKIFQFASSPDAKRDFLKVIHHTIRESVRRMSIPGPKGQAKCKPNIPLGQCKKSDTLVMNPMIRSVGRKKGKQLKGELVRHSMDFDDKYSVMDQQGGNFRTRSRTLTDLNAMDNGQEEANPDACPSGSQSTIASERGSSSAKLLHSSHNPSTYSSAQPAKKEPSGSPIWKPRHATKKINPIRSPTPHEDRTLKDAILGSSAYGDYSNIVYDERHRAVLLTSHNTCIHPDDRDC